MSGAKEKPERWYALDVDLEPAACEAVEYALMEAGALGTETGDESDGLVRIVAYFAETPDRERVRNELFEALRIYELPSSSVRDMNMREVAQHDWLEEWKQNWQPVEIGRFIIAPPWSNLGEVHDRLII
ncbi:MAG TPA: 50S ribosomal protein L11 methyltransferase, partial [Pyrinomonadaceae bacterium]